MKKKWEKGLAVIVIAGALLYVSYLFVTSGKPEWVELRMFCTMICCSCMLLSRIFSTKAPITEQVPADVLENEEYLEAKERQDSGGKILIAGILMMAAPFALLLILGELRDFLASLGLISFFIGVFAVLMGLVVSIGAGKDLAKFPIEYVPDPKPEGLASRIFDGIGMLAAVGIIVFWIIELIK